MIMNSCIITVLDSIKLEYNVNVSLNTSNNESVTWSDGKDIVPNHRLKLWQKYKLLLYFTVVLRAVWLTV